MACCNLFMIRRVGLCWNYDQLTVALAQQTAMPTSNGQVDLLFGVNSDDFTWFTRAGHVSSRRYEFNRTVPIVLGNWSTFNVISE